MDNVLCSTCGTYVPHDYNTDLACPICSDERQYIPIGGQRWTKENELLNTHKVSINKLSECLYELTVSPNFAIGQRAFLILSPNGNILWDCIPLLDQSAIAFIQSLV